MDVAARLFSQKGYEKTTTREIGALVGVQKGSLYYHVRDKEEILYRICTRAISDIQTAVVSAIEAADGPVDKIRAAIAAHVTAMLNEIEFSTTLLNEQRSLTGRRKVLLRRMRDDYEAIIATLLADAQARGLVRSDLSTHDLRLGFMNTVNWTAVWYRHDGRQSPQEIAGWIGDLYLNGALATDRFGRRAPDRLEESHGARA
jgi:AcrR family transcriptional regulator